MGKHGQSPCGTHGQHPGSHLPPCGTHMLLPVDLVAHTLFNSSYRQHIHASNHPSNRMYPAPRTHTVMQSLHGTHPVMKSLHGTPPIMHALHGPPPSCMPYMAHTPSCMAYIAEPHICKAWVGGWCAPASVQGLYHTEPQACPQAA